MTKQHGDIESLGGGATWEYRFPDFLCIGAQKAGTSWLDRNLRRHPKLWLPPMKELRYFSHLYISAARKWTGRQRRERGTQIFNRYLEKNAPSGRDYSLFARLADIVSGTISDNWYGRIFTLVKSDQLRGEVTPDYATLPDDGIRHVLKLSPRVRIILSLRHLIARSWSHIRMLAQTRDINDLGELELSSELSTISWVPNIATRRSRSPAGRSMSARCRKSRQASRRS